MKILFLGANAPDTTRLRIPAELRDVREELQLVANPRIINFHSDLAVRSKDLTRLLLDTQPDIVHFSGHGTIRVQQPPRSGVTREFGRPETPKAPETNPPEIPPAESGILLENNAGKAVPVSPEALTSLFGILNTQRCIVLNACFSAAQAQALTQHVDCVIGMKRAIDDESAITFAAGFYQALARGKSVKDAFELGKCLIATCSLPDANVPELYTKDGIDASTVRFLQPAEIPSAPPPNHPISEGHEQKFPKTPAEEAARNTRQRAISCSLALGTLSFVVGAVVMGVVMARPLEIPSMSSTGRNIVVVGPGSFRSAGQNLAESLCTALDDTAQQEPQAICRARGRGDNNDAVRKKALDAKASVLVLVDDYGIARMYPLGVWANDDRLGHQWPSVDLTRRDAPRTLAPVLHEIARAADGATEGAFDKTRLRCGESLEQVPFGVALPIMVLRLRLPNCLTVPTDIKAFRSQCRGNECHMLDGLLSKPNAPPTDCDQKSDERDQLACRHQQALVACKNGDKDIARQWLDYFNAVSNPFDGIIASEMAACMVVHSKGLSNEEKKALETRGDKPEPGCETSVCTATDTQCKFCAFATGTRAKYWADAGDWKRAERDYERAARASQDNEHLLGMVESRLHRFKDIAGDLLLKQTADDLKRMSNMTAQQKIRAKLLQWVAAKRMGNATYIGATEDSFINAYAELLENVSVYSMDNPDEAERSLVCSRNANACPVYDLLTVPKEKRTADKLREALRQTNLPEE